MYAPVEEKEPPKQQIENQNSSFTDCGKCSFGETHQPQTSLICHLRIDPWSFLKNRQDGRSGVEEADILQVYLLQHGSRPAAWHVLRAADAAVQGPAAAAAAEPRPAEEAALTAEAPVQGQEGGTTYGEAQGGEDAPMEYDHPARDGGLGSMVGMYKGKALNQAEIKPIGYYLRKLSITYQPAKMLRPSIVATHSSCFIPLK